MYEKYFATCALKPSKQMYCLSSFTTGFRSFLHYQLSVPQLPDLLKEVNTIQLCMVLG